MVNQVRCIKELEGLNEIRSNKIGIRAQNKGTWILDWGKTITIYTQSIFDNFRKNYNIIIIHEIFTHTFASTSHYFQ